MCSVYKLVHDRCFRGIKRLLANNCEIYMEIPSYIFIPPSKLHTLLLLIVLFVYLLISFSLFVCWNFIILSIKVQINSNNKIPNKEL